MSYSMSYTWYDVTCNVGIRKSKWTLHDTSYHIRRMTGWALSYCGMRVAGCALYHKVVLQCDVTPRYAVTSLRVTLWRHSALRCDVTPRYAVASLRVTLWRHSALRCGVTSRYAVTWLFTRKTPSYKTYTCQLNFEVLEHPLYSLDLTPSYSPVRST